MANDGEPGNELQQGQRVVNDVDLSGAEVQREVEFTVELLLLSVFFFTGLETRFASLCYFCSCSYMQWIFF